MQRSQDASVQRRLAVVNLSRVLRILCTTNVSSEILIFDVVQAYVAVTESGSSKAALDAVVAHDH